MKTLEVFLAHAVTVEEEAADRYDELAAAMEVRHNEDVAALFRRMAGYSRPSGRSHRAGPARGRPAGTQALGIPMGHQREPGERPRGGIPLPHDAAPRFAAGHEGGARRA